MPTAFVTGLSGQDGSYLAGHLLEMGWDVTGIVRRHSIAETQDSRLLSVPGHEKIRTFYGDVTDAKSIARVLRIVRPDWVFNLAAQSHVRISFDLPAYTIQTNGVGAANVFFAAMEVCPDAKIYQASSSEMFGACCDRDGLQRESTPMHPTSPYGCAKLLAYGLSRHLRRASGMFISNGILFNHGSPRRGSNFVTAKVVKTAVEIATGRAKFLYLGNLDSQRDWGHACDYTKAMIAILEHDEPDDFVVATGKTRSVREMVEYVFDKLGLDWTKHVAQDPRYMRPEELPYLCGDSYKARRVLGWQPTFGFSDIMDEMIEHWQHQY